MAKILVIEDEQPLLEEILETLSFEGFQTEGAPDGRKGLQKAEVFQPDLIISDIAMPEMDGYSVLEQLRQNKPTAVIPLIFLTAKTEKLYMRQGMEMGADDYLTKPFTNAELLAAVRARLSRHQFVAQSKIAQVEEVKHKLAYMIAHELRTPLISITFVHDILSNYLENLSEHDIEEVMDSLAYGNRRMGHVVEQMVLYTSLQGGLLSPDVVRDYGAPTSLGALVTGAISLARKFVYAEVDVSIQFDRPSRDNLIQADTPSLKHAFAEIISNALKFSEAGGAVLITHWRDEGSVWVCVEDSGRGIPEAELGKIPQLFYQIGREKYEQQGTGVGLAVAKNIIEIHGGALQIKSKLGEGTRVYIKLPLVM